MDTFNVTEEGVSLLGAPGSVRHEDVVKPLKPLQAMRLELEAGVLDNILRSARSGGKGVHLSFGKTITLDFGNRSKQLSATVQPTPTELYTYTDEKENQITFAALQTHRLAMKKAQEDTLGADVALAKLQNQLASAEREKQARQIQFAPNNIGLPPAVSRRDAAKSSNPLLATRRKTNSQQRPGNSTHSVISSTHSVVSSPSLGALQSHHNLAAVTSEPSVEDEKAQKYRALKTPLIHFLAVRPVSEKYLGQTLGCDQKDCLEVLQRVGKPYRLDQSKWDLNDKAFKDLDVWKFDYPTQDDRQLAIDRAVSSFDRSRLPGSHPLWQKLLPYHERGKGKVLSNLKLSDPLAQRGTTPRIRVQPTDDPTAAGQTPGNDSDTRQDRLAPSDAEPMARSKSSNPLKNNKGKEKNVRPKVVPSKEAKKSIPGTKSKEKPQDKPTAAKKGGKKGPATNVVAKSSEFVHDSDEEDDEDMPDAPVSKAKPSTPQLNASTAKKTITEEPAQSKKAKPLDNSAKHKVPNAQGIKDHKQSTITPGKSAEKRPPTSSSTSSGTKAGSSDSSHASISMSKSLSRQRTTSSPHKPSPLGSSPPTNASDLDNDSRPISSTSSTPITTQSQAPKIDKAKQATTPAVNGSKQVQTATARPLKRKAPAEDDDTDTHSSHVPLTNGNSLTNGHATNAKRYKASPISPPTSESSTESSTEAKRRQALEEAQRFKKFWAKYQALYLEVATLPKDVPNKKFDDLMRMHERLTGMKAEIAKAALR